MNYENYCDVNGTLTSLPSLSSFDGVRIALITSCFSTSLLLLVLLQLLGILIRLIGIRLLLVLALMLLLLHQLFLRLTFSRLLRIGVGISVAFA